MGLFVAPWTVAYQAPLSVEFSRQEYWSALPFPTPGNLPNPEIKPTYLESPALAGGFFTTEQSGKPRLLLTPSQKPTAWSQCHLHIRVFCCSSQHSTSKYQNLLVFYCFVKKIPQISASKNNKHLLSFNICGSRIHEQHSWPFSGPKCLMRLVMELAGLQCHQKAVLRKIYFPACFYK